MWTPDAQAVAMFCKETGFMYLAVCAAFDLLLACALRPLDVLRLGAQALRRRRIELTLWGVALLVRLAVLVRQAVCPAP